MHQEQDHSDSKSDRPNMPPRRPRLRPFPEPGSRKYTVKNLVESFVAEVRAVRARERRSIVNDTVLRSTVKDLRRGKGQQVARVEHVDPFRKPLWQMLPKLQIGQRIELV